MKPGDRIAVYYFPGKIKTGTIKAASDRLIVVQESPGLVFVLHFDANLNAWVSSGKHPVQFLTEASVPTAPPVSFASKLARLASLVEGL